MSLANRSELIEYLKMHRLWLRKESGQHFLVDQSVLDATIEAAELAGDETVLEIGPGIGTLTAALAAAVPRGLVLAVEKDFRLVTVLRDEFKSKKNVKIIHEDGLRFMRELDGQQDRRTAGQQGPTKLVANLPYNITGPILRNFFDPNPQLLTPNPQLLVLMLQREVVDRLLAPPGSSERGILTILRELFGPAERVVDVSRTSFFPEPAVDSAVVKITAESDRSHGTNGTYDNRRAIVTLAKAGFSAKRRTLENALAGGLRLPKETVRAWLVATQIDPRVRAEDLSLADWGRLAEHVATAYSGNIVV